MTNRKAEAMNGRKIERYPDYLFTECGSVISYVKRTTRNLKPIKMGEYSGVQLKSRDGKIVKAYVHRLIAEAFHGPCPQGHVCRHIDGDRNNNAANNLAWGTQSQNNLDKRKHGTDPSGERNPMAKLTRGDVCAIREMRANTCEPYSKIAQKFGVSTMTAYRAAVGQSWRE